MCTFREIWIPPIILPIPMTSDYVTVSIRSCPEVGDADYIIKWKFSGRSVSLFEYLDMGFVESPNPTQSGKQKKKKAEYRPVGRGVRRVRSLPSQAPEVHLFVDQLLKTKGINTILILIHWMCSKIENTLKELTSPLTLSTKYILTSCKSIEKGIW